MQSTGRLLTVQQRVVSSNFCNAMMTVDMCRTNDTSCSLIQEALLQQHIAAYHVALSFHLQTEEQHDAITRYMKQTYLDFTLLMYCKRPTCILGLTSRK